MTVLRCTQKLLAELRVKSGQDTDATETGWHANLLRIDRYRCVLFTHDQTLFSFFVCRPTRLDFEHFPAVFGQGLFKALLRAGFSQGQVEYMLEATREIRFAKTNNRRVLGSMNNMAEMLEWTISSRGGLAAADPADLQRLLNETPFKAIGYEHPLKRMQDLLSEFRGQHT
ncbi:MAG: hypothetical protein U9Q81_18550 [Pseudomonadota bacterium]|nr:hypothetical protein [Pseudomonadota bacterium]